jgi:LysM repeat protein
MTLTMRSASVVLLFGSIASLGLAFTALGQERSELTAPAPVVDERLERITKDYDALLFAVGKLKPEAFEEVGLYRIEPGDTGAKIAAKHGVMFSDLVALNPDVNWRRLKVWQIVRIRSEVQNQSTLQTPTSGTPAAGAPVAPPPCAADR